MSKSNWYYAETGKNWDLLTKKQKRKWLKHNPPPFQANIHRDELHKLFHFVERTSCDVFSLKHHETGIGGVWKITNLDTKEEYDFTCMKNW